MPVSPMATQSWCAANARSSARSASSKPLAAVGWRPIAAYTCGKSSAAASAARHDAPSMPTVSMRVTPAAPAAATSSVLGGSHRCRWVWESITVARELSRGLREQRLERADGPSERVRVVPARTRQRAVLTAERAEQLVRAGGHVRVQQHRQHAQSSDERAEHAVELARADVVLGQLPRRLLLDVTAQAPHAP